MRKVTEPDGGTVNVLDPLSDGTRRHARRTLARKTPECCLERIVQHLVVVANRCLLQEPEMMPHEPVPAVISASITAGEGGRTTQGTRVSVREEKSLEIMRIVGKQEGMKATKKASHGGPAHAPLARAWEEKCCDRSLSHGRDRGLSYSDASP